MGTINWKKAVKALNEYAEEIPKAVKKMEECNETLWATFNSLRSEIGPHDEEIMSAIQVIQQFLEYNAKPIANMPTLLREKADKIQAKIDQGFGSGQNP